MAEGWQGLQPSMAQHRRPDETIGLPRTLNLMHRPATKARIYQRFFKQGASVTVRQWPEIREFSSSVFNPQAALAAVVGIAALTALAKPASALPGWFGDSRSFAAPPSDTARPQGNVQRAPRAQSPAARAGGKPTLAKTDAAVTALAAKAKGPLHIIVSLDKQQLTLYADGEVIARSRVSTGARGHGTPTGVFSVIQKDRWHRSNLYDDAPMYYMQRITWSGVALHQGIVPNHPASHGCIRLPEAFAQQLWGTTKLGVRVIVAHGEVAPVAFSHPRLFAPKPVPDLSTVSSVEQHAADRALKIAQAEGLPAASGDTATDAPKPGDAPQPAAPALKPGPVSMFISRKEGKLFVRKGFEPVFDVPVAIERADEPLGTHVFTAMGIDEQNTVRWTVVSMPSAAKASPAAALDRIVIPEEARERIAALMSAGASVIISDQGLGPETGKGTDFIVLTR
jgi:lipoprotein-anchoring transpeptidase ErfK/SrfK